MAKDFIIDTQEKKQRFFALMDATLQKDAKAAQEYITANSVETSQIPAALIDVVRDNMHMRAAVVGQLKKNLHEKNPPIGFETLFYQFLGSVADAPLDDAQKREYTGHLATMINPELPSTTTVAQGRAAPLTQESMQVTGMKRKGVQAVIDTVFNNFYLAVTQNEQIRPYSVSYADFSKKRDAFFRPSHIAGR